MSIAEDIIDGWCCQLCGVYFEEEHGYPVVCESCYNELSEEEKKDYQLASHKELECSYHMDAKTFFTKVVLMRKAQKDYFKCRTQQNLRKCKALETEIDGEIERVNSITGVSSVSKEPRQTNLFTD